MIKYTGLFLVKQVYEKSKNSVFCSNSFLSIVWNHHMDKKSQSFKTIFNVQKQAIRLINKAPLKTAKAH